MKAGISARRSTLPFSARVRLDADMIAADLLLDSIVANVERVLIGKTEAVKICLSALLANGHVLLEDVPGVGKTVLAHALAVSVGASFKRIQFTPDLLPGDVTGTQVYRPDTGEFEFRPGPIMTQILLADEINRATPKTQSALLEGMDERKVTVDGYPHRLPEPFLVLATQNPLEFEGTFPLPESQLDRFLVSLRLGYPTREAELEMLSSQEREHPIAALEPVGSVADLALLQEETRRISVGDPVRHYILNLVEATRRHPDIHLGASPRATVALFRMAQASALLDGREYALPDDVKAVAIPVLRHRIVAGGRGMEGAEEAVRDVIARAPVPANRG